MRHKALTASGKLPLIRSARDLILARFEEIQPYRLAQIKREGSADIGMSSASPGNTPLTWGAHPEPATGLPTDGSGQFREFPVFLVLEGD
jgi:hypothetical protein